MGAADRCLPVPRTVSSRTASMRDPTEITPMLTEQDFNALAAQGHNRIPLVAQALADLDTPLSLYLKLTQGQPLSFLLESVVGGERFGRYSFVGLPARTLLRATDRQVEVVTDGQVVETFQGNPLDFIATYHQRFKVAVPQGLPRFCGGLAGYFGYDTVRLIEPRLAQRPSTPSIGTPDILLLQCEELAVIDNLADRLFLIVYADPSQPGAYARAQARLSELQARLNSVVPVPPVAPTESFSVERHFAKDDFEAAVLKCKDYIAAGDCMQVVIGQRLQKRFTASPLTLYRALRSLNPSPYMYYYDMGDHHVVGSSPEILVRQEKNKDGMTGLDVLRASFPAGTLSGAPKIRAMEIIDELEPVQRGVYGGAVGYLSFAGDMDVAIAIRTGVIKDQTLYVAAGAGVGAGSLPHLEWQETEAKARAVIRAAEMVEQGL